MFIAMEISSDHVGWRPFPLGKLAAYRSEMLPSNRSCSRLESLEQKVKEQLKHVRLAALTELKASISMMLSSNHSYLKQEAKEQLERELADILKEHFDTVPTSEPEQKPKQKPPLVHSSRHDAESVFWLLWFLLARANPLSEAPVGKDSVEKKSYDNFCSVMLNHTVGMSIETREVLAGMSIESYRQTLHPRFAHLGDMVYYMGKYFLIDPEIWSDYNKDPLDHAYYFMEFLLLGEMLRNEEAGTLPLNITQPRPATDPRAQVRWLPVSVESTRSHNYAASLTQDNAVSCSVSRLGSKRKADTDPQASPVPKRRCTVPAQPRRSSCRSSHQDHGALAGAPQTGDHDRETEDENQGKLLDPDVEQANYVASQETPETKEQLEQEVFNQWSASNCSLVRTFDAAKKVQ